MNYFKLNGKMVKPKEIDLNLYCDFEEMGIPLESIQKKPFSLLRYYIARCMGTSPALAGKEIEAHIMNGGKLDDLMTVLNEAMEESGFFRALTDGEETEEEGGEKTQ